jgi:HSP20 family protein
MLLRQDPYRELERWSQQFWGPMARPAVMPMDAYKTKDTFVVNFDLPGVEASSIDLTVERNTLTVKAERRWTPSADDEVLIAERPQGEFSRQILLGDALNTDAIGARYEHGVLSLTIPISESVKARKVEISSTEQAAPIAAPAQ